MAAEQTRRPLIAKPDAPTTSDSKVVFLVRHAESLQNVAMRRLSRCDCGALPAFVTLGQDPALSPVGVGMLDGCEPAARALLAGRQIELVVHSPLQRARQTAEHLFGGSGVQMVELENAYELTAQEYLICLLSIDQRLRAVERWLAARRERVIVLVGHEHFFKRALNRHEGIPNVGCVQCSCDAQTGRLFPVCDISFKSAPEQHSDALV